jgi:uncharacterized membrane protein
MTKAEFLSELRAALTNIGDHDVEERIDFYNEMIDDLVEDGMCEEDAISKVGPINRITDEILSDIPLFDLVKRRVQHKRRLRGWELGLIIGLSPIWLALIISVFALAFSLVVAMWSAVLSLWVALLSFAIGAIAGTLGGIAMMFTNLGIAGFMTCGAGIALAGLAILMFYGCKAATKGVAVLTKTAVLGIKKLLI